ncbi:hypothetical protein [Dyadobacter sp. 676]|uniref:Uncharacterized protein n=1 Tax=Dyadobacter sp. 676 TaxID=3088362 RepID=A0AAU8FJV7_9BACT
MTADNAILWLQAERFNQWRLIRGDAGGEREEKVSEYSADEESEAEAVERLRNVLQLLQPGRYTLRGTVGRHKQAAASTFRFEITRQTVTPMHQPQIDQNEMFERAMKLAREELAVETFKKEVLTRLDNLEKKVAEISEAVLDLNDDDEDNDSGAITKLTNVAAQLPTLAKGFETMRGLFKT